MQRLNCSAVWSFLNGYLLVAIGVPLSIHLKAGIPGHQQGY